VETVGTWREDAEAEVELGGGVDAEVVVGEGFDARSDGFVLHRGDSLPSLERGVYDGFVILEFTL
jgi:hypothetical protein